MIGHDEALLAELEGQPHRRDPLVACLMVVVVWIAWWFRRKPKAGPARDKAKRDEA